MSVSIKVEDLSKRFGSFQAVRDVSFSLQQGETGEALRLIRIAA